jgi:peptidoglycan/LPS O-acetylase OafA/YrhL
LSGVVALDARSLLVTSEKLVLLRAESWQGMQKRINVMAPVGFKKLDRRRDLDGLRGVAIILVIIFHYVFYSSYFHYLGPKPVALFLNSFWSGVDIFFVLSGFLIGGIILDSDHTDNFFRVFYLRRALRILPVAFLAIAFCYLVIPFIDLTVLSYSQVPPYAYVLFINNFWTANGLHAYMPLGPLWSLAIEEQFYVVAPAFILLVNSRARNITLLAIVFISPILRMCKFHYSFWDFTIFRLDGFSAGILVAVLLREAHLKEFATRYLMTINALVFGVLIAALIFSVAPGYSLRERVAFGISLNSLAAAGVILSLHLNGNCLLSRALAQPWLAGIGRLSYFMYLMHVPILMCVGILPGPRLIQPFFAFGICLLYAWASWRLLESRLINFGKRFRYRRPALIGATGLAAATGGAGDP